MSPIYSLLVLAGLSFTFCFALTPLVRNAFRNAGLVDRPNGGRKAHPRPIPRVGGIPVALSCALALAAMMALPPEWRPHMTSNLEVLLRLLPAIVLMFLTGLADDLFDLSPWAKLAGQTAAAALAYWGGVRIVAGPGQAVEMWWSLPVTMLWLVACANAFNLIDGVDGLASGVAFFAAVTVLLAALLQRHLDLAFVAAPIAGALLAFLRFNFNPASIFLGDSGSLLLGFTLGCCGVLWSQKSSTMLGMTAPLLAVAIPLLDTGLAIARRIVRHQPVFGGDAGHIHHRLLARGLTPRRVALVLYALTGCAAGCSLLLSMADNEFGGLVIVLFCAGAWLGIQHLGYTEFGVARRMLFQGVFGDLVDAHVTLRSLEEELRKADTAEECWEAVRRSCREFGFSDAALRLGGRTFEAHFPRTIGAECWSLRVPLSGSDHLALARPFQTEAMPGIVDPFVELVRSVLRPRLAAVELRRVNEEDEGERKAASA